MTYLYDVAGRMTSMTYPGGQVVSYGYDSSGAVLDITAQHGASLLVADYDYDNMGRLDEVTLGNNDKTYFDYDPIGRLDGHQHLGINLTTFSHNPAGQIKSRSVTHPAMQTAMPTSSPSDYTVNVMNQYSFVDGFNPLGYDDNGNLTSFDGWTYGYDDHNRLDSATTSGTSVSLHYDPVGRLNTTTLNGVATEYVYSGNQLIGEFTASGSPIRLYVYAPGSDIPVAQFSGSNGLNDMQYLKTDERGSIVAIINEQGGMETLQYDAYGVELTGSDSLFQYTGQIQIRGTDLYHYKARAYHPELGRFMQTDPIGYDDGMNMYAYVGNDPVNAVDPLGMAKCSGSLSESQCNQALDDADAARDGADDASAVLGRLASKVGENAELSDSEQGVLDAVEERFGEKLTSAKNLNKLAKKFSKIANKIGERGEGATLRHGGNDVPFSKHDDAPAYVLVGKSIYLNDNYFTSSDNYRKQTMVHEAAHLAGAWRNGYIRRGERQFFNSLKALKNADTYACQVYPSVCGF